MLTFDDELPQAFPTTMKKANIPSFNMPTDVHPPLQQLIENHRELFSWTTCSVISHVIDTGDASLIRVPPCPILFHYDETVHRQPNEMANNSIIQPSSSPWCAPAVHVPKWRAEDFVQLNHISKKILSCF